MRSCWHGFPPQRSFLCSLLAQVYLYTAIYNCTPMYLRVQRMFALNQNTLWPLNPSPFHFCRELRYPLLNALMLSGYWNFLFKLCFNFPEASEGLRRSKHALSSPAVVQCSQLSTFNVPTSQALPCCTSLRSGGPGGGGRRNECLTLARGTLAAHRFQTQTWTQQRQTSFSMSSAVRLLQCCSLMLKSEHLNILWLMTVNFSWRIKKYLFLSIWFLFNILKWPSESKM